MKVAIIGGGISGLMAADTLNGHMDYSLYEAAPVLGGHADSHDIEVDGQPLTVDTGFLVFNEDRYHHFVDMLRRYKVPYENSDMSFAVSNRHSGLEYNATNLKGLFCQRKNLISAQFYRMILDIRRFYRQAPAVLDAQDNTGIYEFLQRENYSQVFIHEHMMPMVSALWSGDFDTVKDYPVHYLLRFMANHQMLQLTGRPVWRTITGGSRNYVSAIQRHMQGRAFTATPVQSVLRDNQGVLITTEAAVERYDAVIFATHVDDTLALIEQPTLQEAAALGGIRYVDNDMVLHTDASLLPHNPKAWASWSVNYYGEDNQGCQVNYYLNKLQNLTVSSPVIVSLNQTDRINPDLCLVQKTYRHPVYDRKTPERQQQIQALQGHNNSYYCGAYLGWGFHEDGAQSGVEAARRLLERHV
ncbi:dehydrogenase [Marinicella pacifica]|uniref:Dehydrogenase n=1 Tax=Marinicella pacifica TaxID=1171543 RepID=A0A917FSL8_9GAMM|nr:FAD-dependent oxidoreductase [Marinicella pacifica]GGG01848.1 dehydrogenase [Marinicella pacifica]